MSLTAHRLTPEQIDAFGAEMDDLRDRLTADLGERDAEYIRKVIRVQRQLELSGRGLLALGIFPPAWVAGVCALSVAKILDNMEIGHNVMHGQYEWTGDPALQSEGYEWDNTCPGEQWRHSHNYMHHTFTNIVGKDRDVGYGVLRLSEEQAWNPYYLGNPLYATWLALLFQWGVAFHDLEFERVLAGKTSLRSRAGIYKGIWEKAHKQVLKDYVLYPLLAGPSAPFTLAGNVTANVARNLWSFSIIFCGHFPDGTHEFSEAESEDESPGQWYVRQLLGSANITGGPLFHVMSGHLSHQIEHHLFPDIPAHRYREIAGEVQAACEKYGLDYNQGPLPKQLASVAKRICRLALPDRLLGGDTRSEREKAVRERTTEVSERHLRAVA